MTITGALFSQRRGFCVSELEPWAGSGAELPDQGSPAPWDIRQRQVKVGTKVMGLELLSTSGDVVLGQ